MATVAERWWVLADALSRGAGWHSYPAGPVIALAERLGGTDARIQAGIYLHQAADVLRSSWQPAPDMVDGMIDKALALDPDNAYAHYLRALVHLRRDDATAAAEALTDARRTQPDQPDVAHELAILDRPGGLEPIIDRQLTIIPEGVQARPGYWGGPAVWSPDSRYLAVRCVEVTPDEVAAYRPCILSVPSGDLEVVRVDGDPVGFAWLPADPPGLLVTTRAVNQRDSLDLWAVSPGGSPYRLAAGGEDAAPSPDGSQLVYAHQGLWLLALDTDGRPRGMPRRLTDGPRDLRPLWDPDGRTVYFAQDTRGGGGDGAPSEQWLARLDVERGGAPEVVDETARHIIELRWFEPGRSLVVHHGWDDWWGTDLVRVTGEVLEYSEFDYGRAVPDPANGLVWLWDFRKGRLAAVRPGQDPTSATGPVRELRLTGWDDYPALTAATSFHADPRGRRLAYIYNRPGPSAIFVREWAGGSPPVFIRFTGLSQMPLYWSPDGRYLAAFEEGGGIIVHQLPDLPSGGLPQP